MWLIKVLILPPTPLFLLLLTGWLVRYWARGLGNGLMVTAVFLLYALSTPIVGGLLIHSLESSPPVRSATPDPDAGAIVVLSAGLYRQSPEFGGDTSDEKTLVRLRYAAKLGRDFGLPILVTGGVIKPGDRPIAELMRDTLVDEFHVPVRWIEPRAKNTYENAAFSAEILREAGIGTVYLVTHSWHMPRSKAIFEAQGLGVIPAPTIISRPPSPTWRDFLPSAGALGATAFAMHEWIGRLWYDLRYD